MIPSLPLITPSLPVPDFVTSLPEKLVAPAVDFAESLSTSPATVESSSPMLREFATRHRVMDPKAPLNQAGLPGQVQEGAFRVRVHRSAANGRKEPQNEIHDIRIRRPNDDHGTSLDDVAAELNRIAGVKATITDDGQLVVRAQETSVRFALDNDTSGLLESLGEDRSPLREAFDTFVGQALFGQALASMRKTLDKPAYLHGGRAEEVFQAQLDQALAESVTAARGGQLAEDMYEQQFNAMYRR